LVLDIESVGEAIVATAMSRHHPKDGVIVVIRTFLSFSLEVELEGRLPWQPKRATSATRGGLAS